MRSALMLFVVAAEESRQLAGMRRDDARTRVRIELVRARPANAFSRRGVDDERQLDRRDELAHARVRRVVVGAVPGRSAPRLVLEELRGRRRRSTSSTRSSRRGRASRSPRSVITVTSPAPVRIAPRAHSTAAPLRPGEPAMIATWPYVPLCVAASARRDVRLHVARRDQRERDVLVLDRGVGDGDVGDDHFAAVASRPARRRGRSSAPRT